MEALYFLRNPPDGLSIYHPMALPHDPRTDSAAPATVDGAGRVLAALSAYDRIVGEARDGRGHEFVWDTTEAPKGDPGYGEETGPWCEWNPRS